MTTLAASWAGFRQPPQRSGAVSDAARAVFAASASALASYLRTARGQELSAVPKGKLDERLAMASEMAAIGEGQMPVAAAVAEAHALIDSLPEALNRPAPVVEPSGAIAFEWDLDPDHYAILAVKGTGVLEYSIATAPGERHWGYAPFTGRLSADLLKRLAALGLTRADQ